MSGQPAVRGHSGLGAEAAKFGRNAAVYLAATLLVRGMTILLTPLYTRAMAPADFAALAVANAVASVLALVIGLDLSACIPRLSYEYDDAHRRLFHGTLLTLSTLVPLAFLGVAYVLGETGHLELFESIHFRPHLELVLWSSYFAVFLQLPLAIYNTREEPAKASTLSGASAVLQLGFTLLFVARLHQGAVGALRANLASAAVVGVVAFVLVARMSAWAPKLPGAKRALAYSLPLVPHLVANWALAISDRLILDRYVAPAEIGRYALAYMFNVLLGVVAASIGSALSPMAYRQLRDPVLTRAVPPLGTYAVLLMLAAGLGIALTAPEVIAVIAPPSYERATAVVPWVTLGAVFQGLYYVLSIGTWFSMKTKPVAVVTLVSAALNVGVNLVFVPRYGVMAAAASTAIAYAVSALLHGLLAHRLHPIPWEYGRWALAGAIAAVWYWVGSRVPLPGLAPRFAAHAMVALFAFPATLVLVRFFSAPELARARALAGRVGARLR